MKTSIYKLIAVALMSLPLVVKAQSVSPVNRAEVRAELVQLEQAGYRPGDRDIHYPDALEAAEARVHAQQETSGMGGANAGSSESGGRLTVDQQGLYARH